MKKRRLRVAGLAIWALCIGRCHPFLAAFSQTDTIFGVSGQDGRAMGPVALNRKRRPGASDIQKGVADVHL